MTTEGSTERSPADVERPATREEERRIKRRTRELLGQWQTARWGMGEEEVAEDWARERALLEAEIEALR